MHLKKTPSAHYASGFGDFMQSLSSFLICLVVTTLMLGYIALLDCCSYGSDSCGWYILKGVCWCIKLEVGSLFGWGASE